MYYYTIVYLKNCLYTQDLISWNTVFVAGFVFLDRSRELIQGN